jgi:hypothetical protein
MTRMIELLHGEHRDVEKLLNVLEDELKVFDRRERLDYEVIQAIISYFQDYPDCCHHPKEDMIFDKLKARNPPAAKRIGDVEAEHRQETERLDRVARVVRNVLLGREIARRRSVTLCAISSITNGYTWQWRSERYSRLPRTHCDRKIGRRSNRSGTIKRKHCLTLLWKRNVTHFETAFFAGAAKTTRAGLLIGTKSIERRAKPVSSELDRSFNEAVETELLRR